MNHWWKHPQSPRPAALRAAACKTGTPRPPSESHLNSRVLRLGEPRAARILCGAFSLTLLTLLTLTTPSTVFASEAPASPLPRPLRTELPPSFWSQYGWLLGVTAVLVIIFTGFCIWRLRRPKPTIIPSPETFARSALEALRGRTPDGTLISEVSQILRHYIIAAYNLAPHELTTAELQSALQALPQSKSDLFAAITDFLHRCDEWKFAHVHSAPQFDPLTGALELITKIESLKTQPPQVPQPGSLSPTT